MNKLKEGENLGRRAITGRVNCGTQIPVDMNELILKYKEETGLSKNAVIERALKYFFRFHEIAVTDAQGEVAAVISASRPDKVIERDGFRVIAAAYPDRLRFDETEST